MISPPATAPLFSYQTRGVSFSLIFLALMTHAIQIPRDHKNVNRRDFARRLVFSSVATGTGSVFPDVASAFAPEGSSLVAESGAEAEPSSLEAAIRAELESRLVRWDVDPTSSTPESSTVSPFRSVRYGTSTLSSTSRSPRAQNPPISLPAWLAGTWSVGYKFSGAAFPQSKGILSLRVPGAGLGTCLSIPNVGYNPPPFAVRFNEAKVDGRSVSYEDLAYSIPRRFEAFWSQAKVTSVRTGDAFVGEEVTLPCFVTGEGCTLAENRDLHSAATRIIMEYEGPTRSGSRRIQTVDATAVGGLSILSPNDASVIASRQYVQYNVQQDFQTYFKEIITIKRVGEGAEGLVRVAAYLPYAEDFSDASSRGKPKYEEALTIAIYDYKLSLQRVTEEEAASM